MIFVDFLDTISFAMRTMPIEYLSFCLACIAGLIFCLLIGGRL